MQCFCIKIILHFNSIFPWAFWSTVTLYHQLFWCDCNLLTLNWHVPFWHHPRIIGISSDGRNKSFKMYVSLVLPAILQALFDAKCNLGLELASKSCPSWLDSSCQRASDKNSRIYMRVKSFYCFFLERRETREQRFNKHAEWDSL